MREIKFRARYRDTLGVIEDFMIDEPIENVNSEALYVDQYTGLKDKNGVEIYEGDIVRSRVADESITRDRWVITYDDIGMRFAGAESIDPPVGSDMWHMDDAQNTRDSVRAERGRFILCEVIGNIYENPELLAPKAGDAQV